MLPQSPTYTVSQVNTYVKSLFDGDPTLNRISVRGELSNYKPYPSGHHYFSLKDASGTLRCVMFRSAATRLRLRPENGMQVVVFGRITVFPRDGSYQLYADLLTPDGVGALYVAFEQLKQKLQSEGLFDPARKQPLPRMPETIGLITSPAGAAVHDMLRILRARWPLARIRLLPVRVQGAEAPREIAAALDYANQWQVADVLLLARGGGSMEDLWAFNDEQVARAIARSRLPIVSGVGHEPDVTIADFAADLRAATPSNAAELAAPDQAEVAAALAQLRARLLRAYSTQLQLWHSRLERCTSSRVLTDPMAPVNDRRLLLDDTRRRLASAAERRLSTEQQRLSALCAGLDAMSPLKVLARGYAVARHDGCVLRRAAQTAPGDSIDVLLSDGTLFCTVNEIKELP